MITVIISPALPAQTEEHSFYEGSLWGDFFSYESWVFYIMCTLLEVEWSKNTKIEKILKLFPEKNRETFCIRYPQKQLIYRNILYEKNNSLTSVRLFD